MRSRSRPAPALAPRDLTEPSRLNEAAARQGTASRAVLLTGRIGLLRPLSRQELSDGRDQPSAPPHDRGHDGPQSLAGDTAILRPRGVEVQPVFRPVAGQADAGGRSHLPGPPRLEGRGVGEPQPDGGGAAVLLRRHARDGGDPRADRLRPRAAASAGGAERRRGGAVPRGRARA